MAAEAGGREVSAPAPDYWPEGAQAVAHLTRVQKLLSARGLDGTERHLKPLMKLAAAAFRARDLAGVAEACGALVDAIEGPPKGGQK